tara:strand:- start:7804 stop:8346 length:543 start_codon:yes stop_codon:yes gene_type:complete
MSLALTPAKVGVAFYTRPDWVTGARKLQSSLVKIFCRTDLHHCGLLITRGDSSVVLAADKYHRTRFIDQECYHEKVMKPCRVVELGEANVSLEQMMAFLREPYMGDARSLIFWYFIGRFWFPRMLPPSCALITCQLLRLSGFNVPNIIAPVKLYKELTNATNSYSGTSKSWEDYVSENYS